MLRKENVRGVTIKLGEDDKKEFTFGEERNPRNECKLYLQILEIYVFYFIICTWRSLYIPASVKFFCSVFISRLSFSTVLAIFSRLFVCNFENFSVHILNYKKGVNVTGAGF